MRVQYSHPEQCKTQSHVPGILEQPGDDKGYYSSLCFGLFTHQRELDTLWLLRTPKRDTIFCYVFLSRFSRLLYSACDPIQNQVISSSSLYRQLDSPY